VADENGQLGVSKPNARKQITSIFTLRLTQGYLFLVFSVMVAMIQSISDILDRHTNFGEIWHINSYKSQSKFHYGAKEDAS